MVRLVKPILRPTGVHPSLVRRAVMMLRTAPASSRSNWGSDAVMGSMRLPVALASSNRSAIAVCSSVLSIASPDSVGSGVATAAEHLLDLGQVQVLVADHLAGVLLEGHAASLHQTEQRLVEVYAALLVHQHLLHHLVHGRVVAADQFGDAERHD